MDVEYEGTQYQFPDDTDQEIIMSFLAQNNYEPPEEPSQPATVEPISQEPEFIDRINNPQNYPVISNPDGSISTHRMAAEIDPADKKWKVFPTIQMIDGKLQEFGDPFDALASAKQYGNFISMPNKKSALAYTDSYKEDTPLPVFAFKHEVANHQFMDDKYLDVLASIESSNNPIAESTSGALGLHQFLGKTWKNVAERYTPYLVKNYSEQELLKLRTDPKVSRYMADMLTRENAANMKKRGAKITHDSLYLAHFLGVGEASNVVLANPSTDISKVVSSKTRKNNPNVFKNVKTAGDLIRWSDAKVREHGSKL